MRRLLPSSMTARLVVSVVLLVAVVCALVSALTAAAVESNLDSQLDTKVAESHQRDVRAARRGFIPRQPPAGAPNLAEIVGQDAGTLTAYLSDGVDAGRVISEGGEFEELEDRVLDELGDLGDGGDETSVDRELPRLGEYRLRVTAVGDVVVVTGYPTADLAATMAELVAWEAAFSLLGMLAAGGVATVVVRRQLAPLREVARTAHDVAELPLARGEVGLTARVPDRLTDERSEVGQVAVALNTLLDHMEASLDARHRSEQQVRRFVADASHELRTPLAVIQGYAELALQRADERGMAHAMDKVQGEAHRMTALVEDLLLLARLDAGRPLVMNEVDLSRLAMETVADARVLAGEHHWRLVLSGEAVTVAGDEQRLHQVLTNLLTNARRHTPAGTTVTVGVTVADGAASVRVHDDGPGIPAALQSTLFERFTRGDASRTRDSGGAGLGLSLARAIAEAHGGSLSASSRPGSTTLTLDLPR